MKADATTSDLVTLLASILAGLLPADSVAPAQAAPETYSKEVFLPAPEECGYSKVVKDGETMRVPRIARFLKSCVTTTAVIENGRMIAPSIEECDEPVFDRCN